HEEGGVLRRVPAEHAIVGGGVLRFWDEKELCRNSPQECGVRVRARLFGVTRWEVRVVPEGGPESDGSDGGGQLQVVENLQPRMNTNEHEYGLLGNAGWGPTIG